jgi:hypothetical protein
MRIWNEGALDERARSDFECFAALCPASPSGSGLTNTRNTAVQTKRQRPADP